MATRFEAGAKNSFCVKKLFSWQFISWRNKKTRFVVGKKTRFLTTRFTAEHNSFRGHSFRGRKNSRFVNIDSWWLKKLVSWQHVSGQKTKACFVVTRFFGGVKDSFNENSFRGEKKSSFREKAAAL